MLPLLIDLGLSQLAKRVNSGASIDISHLQQLADSTSLTMLAGFQAVPFSALLCAAVTTLPALFTITMNSI
jgi:hypothetical protein